MYMTTKVLIPHSKKLNSKKNLDTSDKLRGGYYTPEPITRYLAHWAIKKPDAKVLEPSCGDGQFIAALKEKYGEKINITGVELFSDEAKKAVARGNIKTKVIVSDAFSWFLNEKPTASFDAVIGNPPFIRYQNFPEQHRNAAFNIMREEGFNPSKLTNAWLPFVVMATKALVPGGRLAMVLPAELMQVTYALELRKYLTRKFNNLHIVTFRKLVFEGIQQEVILLMGERKDCISSKISFIEFENLKDLTPRKNLSKQKVHEVRNIDHDNEKWTQYYLSSQELDLIRSIEKSTKFRRLGEIAEIDVGVVTGNNSFFILSKEEAENLKVTDYCSPIVGRSAHLPGILYKSSDHDAISKNSEKNLLLNIGKIPRENLSKDLVRYISEGEKAGAGDGYKCQIRLPHWWHVPSTWTPDGFLLRQIHEGPRIISNKTESTSTDTIHRVRIMNGIPSEILAAASVNSLTFAMAEIRGRSYGGGVLELEPTEAENLLLPLITENSILPLKKIDQLLRQKKTVEALNLVDSILLKKAGLNDKEIQILRGIWDKLRSRRNSRRFA